VDDNAAVPIAERWRGQVIKQPDSAAAAQRCAPSLTFDEIMPR
jgi:hypothetical protein